MKAHVLLAALVVGCSSSKNQPPPPGADATAPDTGSFGTPDMPTGPSLKGTVYFIPDGTQKFPDVTNIPPAGVLFAPQLDVAPGTFQTTLVFGHFDFFAIRYAGQFNVAVAGDHAFRVKSDDGAIVSIDSMVVVDNDGIHGPTDKSGNAMLMPGMHQIQVDYFESKRWTPTLQLWITRPGGVEELFHPD